MQENHLNMMLVLLKVPRIQILTILEIFQIFKKLKKISHGKAITIYCLSIETLLRISSP